jgi:alpha-galactosidase
VNIVPVALGALVDNRSHSGLLRIGAPVGLGPLEAVVNAPEPGGAGGEAGRGRLTWSVANRSDRAVSVRSVAIEMSVEAAPPLRMYRHGYQSWSPSGVAVLGVDQDPSIHGGSEVLRAVLHADQRVVDDPRTLRSEWFTVLADEAGAAALVAFEGAGEHDGTLWLSRRDDIRLRAEAFLGGITLEPGETRQLHPVVIEPGPVADVEVLLAHWAGVVGTAASARTNADYQIGWCSWYHYFHHVTEADVLANLELADGWPFEVFQVDDGYQSAIGDWLTTAPSFPSGLDQLAHRVTTAGYRPGIWLAPFLVAPDSEVARRHPEWLARRRGHDGTLSPLFVWRSPTWGGGQDGLMCCLDTTQAEVLAHLEELARALVSLGYTYLKLDFAFAPSADGVWHNTAVSPAQRVRDGIAAIRRGAGPDTFLLGCGVPLSHVVGLVDGARIGQDVAPVWALQARDDMSPAHMSALPSTQSAYSSTAARSFMHRRLWLNDPDCLMLRSAATRLEPSQAVTWARAVGVSGGMALVSDDLSLLDASSRVLLDQCLEIGRSSDAAARAGAAAVATDLMDAPIATTMEAAGYRLVVDTVLGTSELTQSVSE